MRPSHLLTQLTAVAAFCALAAVVNSALTFLAIALTTLVLLLAVIDIIISRNDPSPQGERLLPLRVVKGQRAIIGYRLSRHHGSSTVVTLLDELPAVIGGDLIIDHVELKPGQIVVEEREVSASRRGAYDLGPTFVRWQSRLGLIHLRTSIVGAKVITVQPPASSPRRRTGIEHRSLDDESGVRPRPSRGERGEFESMREYVPGDDPRVIDWHASARRGRLQVRQYQTERRHTVMIAIDTGRLMASHVDGVSKLDHAIDSSLALARMSAGYGDRVGFLAFDDELRSLLRPTSGSTGVARMVEAVSTLKASDVDPDYCVLAETLSRHQQKRALVIVMTDFVEGGASRELENYLSVIARRHYLMLIAMRDRILNEVDEREPDITRERIYRRLALQDLVIEREAVLARIGRLGAQTLDLDPARITASVLNQYLAVRRRALI